MIKQAIFERCSRGLCGMFAGVGALDVVDAAMDSRVGRGWYAREDRK